MQATEVIITFNDGRPSYICPNTPAAIEAQYRVNSKFIKSVKPHDPNAKPPEPVKKAKTYTQAEVDAMMADAIKGKDLSKDFTVQMRMQNAEKPAHSDQTMTFAKLPAIEKPKRKYTKKAL
jgi:hypothetical protein